MWKTFTKAKQPGWGCLIPFYNIYLMTQIAGKPGWWLLLYFVPLVNIVIAIIVLHNISKKFGHGAGFTVGLVFLPMIFYAILGFGDSQYQA
jgi:hypothetical protein